MMSGYRYESPKYKRVKALKVLVHAITAAGNGVAGVFALIGSPIPLAIGVVQIAIALWFTVLTVWAVRL